MDGTGNQECTPSSCMYWVEKVCALPQAKSLKCLSCILQYRVDYNIKITNLVDHVWWNFKWNWRLVLLLLTGLMWNPLVEYSSWHFCSCKKERRSNWRSSFLIVELLCLYRESFCKQMFSKWLNDWGNTWSFIYRFLMCSLKDNSEWSFVCQNTVFVTYWVWYGRKFGDTEINNLLCM